MEFLNILELSASCSDPGVAVILSILSKGLSLMQLIIPILLIIMVSIGFTQLMMNPDDKKGPKNLTNKFVAATIAIFIPTLVNTTMSLLSDYETFEIAGCWSEAEEMNSQIQYNKNNYVYHRLSDEEKKPITNQRRRVTITDDGSSNNNTNSGSTAGERVVNEALTYVGVLDYVWGGTSLTTGADCSGFVQSLYAKQGISLNRVAADQATNGTAVSSLSAAKAGDLIFYSGTGGIGHVAIFMGDGNKIVHASNSREGIKITENANYRTIVAIRRVS